MSATEAHQTGQVDAIVVLGAAVWKGGQPSPALRRRVLHAVALMREARSRVMLVSGGLGRHPPTEAEVMRDLALAEGVAPEHIVVEDQSTSTFESVLQCSRIMHQQNWSTAIVVTDPYHLFRAILTFRCFGIRAAGRAATGGRQSNPIWKWCYYYLREFIALPWYLLLILAAKLRNRA